MVLQTLGIDEVGESPHSYITYLLTFHNIYCEIHSFSDKWQSFVPNLYNCYLLALKEYTIDSRGDIGAWVREAAMIGLHVRVPL